MRVAVVSDVHGNLTALEAVIADLRKVAPDVVLQGGDLPFGGARPREVVDRVRELRWAGVRGNTDEILWAPESLREFAASAPPLKKPLEITEQLRAWACPKLGAERIAWLESMPMVQRSGELAVVHASVQDTWRGPGRDAGEAEFEKAFGMLGARVVVYGHIHVPFVRNIGEWTVANAGSVSLSYDGDGRASYALVDGEKVEIRRVAYDVEREAEAAKTAGMPHSKWLGTCLRAGRYVAP